MGMKEKNCPKPSAAVNASVISDFISENTKDLYKTAHM
jgi:hypothetical protein